MKCWLLGIWLINWTECNDFDFIPYSVRMNHERL